MKFLKYIFILILMPLLFNSCETDFDVNAEWEDITVVYGLIDQKSNTQYIKINKAFLGEGNALYFATIEDSSNYSCKLNVTLEAWDNGNLAQILEFDTTTIYNKEPGIFYYPKQIIYKTKPYDYYSTYYIINPVDPLDTLEFDTLWLNGDYTYKLKIKNPITAKEITSETPLVNDFSINKPNYHSEFIKFLNKPGANTQVVCNTAKNGIRYEIFIQFNYKELEYNSTDTIYKKLDLAFDIQKSESTTYKIEYFYMNEGFFILAKNNIPYKIQSEEDKIKDRFTGKVDFIISVAAEEFDIYLDVNEPSNSIVQEKPEYTNINNGIGIFSSRCSKMRSKPLHTETVGELINMNIKFRY